ncbi:MAG TPA: glycosyltransferase [Polyangia bacterium]|nr:glycosyltransferase [Polyangia bacterium]
MKLSVIVPTRDKAEHLDRTLASYCAQTHGDFEVVIADDGSRDDAGERVAARWRERFAVEYLRQPHRGRAACRNRAIAAARGELLVFADDDRLAAPQFLAEHARLYDAARATVVLGAQRRAGAATVEEVAGDFAAIAAASSPEPWWEEACAPLARAYGERLDGFHIPWILGATGNLSAPRALVVEVGGFDEAFHGWGLEDLDLCYRLHHAGARTVIGAAAINYHQAHPTAGDGVRWIEWLRNLERFVEKYDRLDAAAYAYAYTRETMVDVPALNDTIAALERDAAAAPATTRALREAYVAIVRARIFALDWSGAHRLPGIRW